MTTQPQWSPVDDETASLLSLVAVGPMSGHADHEWEHFKAALKFTAWESPGRSEIRPNALRRRLRNHVAPQRIGAFTNRALARGLIAWRGEWETSDDKQGRNSGKPAKVYRWIGGDQ